MKINLTTIEEIKKAVDQGYLVNCGTIAYKVIKDDLDQYLIVCTINQYTIGLHGQAGTKYENKLNGQDFYVDNPNYEISEMDGKYYFHSPDFDIEICGKIKSDEMGDEFEPDDFLGQESEIFWDENWEEISEKIIDFSHEDKRDKSTTYFLFGETACDLFEEGETTTEDLASNGYAVFKFVQGVTTAIEFAEAMVGWNDYKTISKEDYLRLQ